MSGPSDFKPERRIIDPSATRRTLLRYRACIACGAPASNGHHLLPVGRGQTGDDVEANILSLCGTGSLGCHGALHGSPYYAVVNVAAFASVTASTSERRDADWVTRRIGERLPAERPDSIAYVLAKLGDTAGRDFLRRRYHLDLEAA